MHEVLLLLELRDDDMTIEFECQCGKRLRVKDEHAGKKVKCPACGEPLVVPRSKQSARTETAGDSARASARGVINPPCRFKFTGTGGELFKEVFVGMC